MPTPNFFIVGAPRCATTFMYRYLRQHPQIFMPDLKEPYYLCSDLDSGTEDDDKQFIRQRETYLSLFDGATQEPLIGEASPFTLYSREAPGHISELTPAPRLLVQVREPVEQMYSFHNVRAVTGYEDLPFAQALDAETDRRNGRRLPARAHMVPMYQYREVARYSDPIQRYIDRFGRESVHIIVYEDLLKDAPAVYRSVLSFLGADPSFRPDLRVVNMSVRPRNRLLFGLMFSPTARRGVKTLAPRRLHGALRPAVGRINSLNRRPASRPSLDPRLRRALRDEFAGEVATLSALLGRDLASLWYGSTGAISAELPSGATADAVR
ncbi:hypothetical protein BH20CHL6_BH20CHL6_04730 [soil metagenome]